jgi:hypothetical protein
MIMNFVVHAFVLGVGAMLVMDLWGLFQRRVLGVATLDYALLGRWIGHIARGRVRHERIADAAPIRGERALGWSAHYAIGITFAGLLLAIWGLRWAREPSLGPALLVALATLVAPFLILQPAFGAGIAASRTPRPNAARLRSVCTHLAFGFGLYVTARLWLALGGG